MVIYLSFFCVMEMYDWNINYRKWEVFEIGDCDLCCVFKVVYCIGIGIL